MTRKASLDWDDHGLAAVVDRITKHLGMVDCGPSTYDGRKIIGVLPDGKVGSLHFEPVSATNAGQYRGWVAMSKQAWGRAMGARPDAVRSFTVMVARGPSDDWWWGQAFDDDKLRRLEGSIHWVRPGYGRVAPSTASAAMATPVVDVLQTTLWEQDSPLCDHPAVVRPDGQAAGWRCAICGVPFVPQERKQ